MPTMLRRDEADGSSLHSTCITQFSSQHLPHISVGLLKRGAEVGIDPGIICVIDARVIGLVLET